MESAKRIHPLPSQYVHGSSTFFNPLYIPSPWQYLQVPVDNLTSTVSLEGICTTYRFTGIQFPTSAVTVPTRVLDFFQSPVDSFSPTVFTVDFDEFEKGRGNVVIRGGVDCIDVEKRLCHSGSSVEPRGLEPRKPSRCQHDALPVELRPLNSLIRSITFLRSVCMPTTFLTFLAFVACYFITTGGTL